MPNTLKIANNWCFWQYLWLSSIQDHRLSTHPSKGRLSRGRQHVACYVAWAALLSAVALRTLYFTHFKLFYFPNVIGLVQRIVRFVMRTEPKALYRTVQYEYAYRYTPNIHSKGMTQKWTHRLLRSSLVGLDLQLEFVHKVLKASQILAVFLSLLIDLWLFLVWVVWG